MADYESLKDKYRQSQAECRKLKEKLATTEAELHTLQNALEPAVDEYGQLQRRLQIERDCRTEAEKYACKLQKKNVELKRRSQQLLDKMQIVDISLDVDQFDLTPDSSGDEDNTRALNKQILLLEETVRGLEGRLVLEETEKLAAYERETQLVSKIRSLEEELADSQQQIEDFHKEMKKIRRVSELAWKEFEELKADNERLMMLQSEAENYAYRMLSERDAIKRESSILMSSAMTDERLASALITIEQLTVRLSQEQHQHQQQMESLRSEMDCSALQQHVSELEDKLSVAVSENERLQRGVTELEKCKEKLEKENVDLVNKLDVAEQKLRPPPPPPAPPPPPPSFFSPLKLLIKKKPASASSAAAATTRAGTARDKTYEEALKEMMERIKTGQALKSTTVQQPDGGSTRKDSAGSTAIDNLQNLLHGRQCNTSMDEVIARQKTQRQASEKQQQQHDAADCELQRAFQRLRQPHTPVPDVVQ